MALVRPSSGFEQQIARGLEALGETLPALESDRQRTERIGVLLDAVVEWNARVDLTAARDPDELVDLFIADAVVLATSPSTRSGERWLDVGSGAGAPGLVFALLCPNVAVTLVEPKTKRVAFLRLMTEKLAVKNVSIARVRAEDLPDGSADVAVSRATLTPQNWLELGTRLARRAVWVLLAKNEPPGDERWSATEHVVYRWPLTGVERRAVRFEPA